MPNESELRILAVAVSDGEGEYCLQRDWNKRWGAEHTDMKSLEDCGLMKITSAGRDRLTKQWFRRSVITDAGRLALAATRA